MSIQCAICGKDFANITGHLRKHNMTKQEYVDKYPGYPLVDEETANRLRKQNPTKGKKHSEETKSRIGKSVRGQKRTEETKRKISDSRKSIVYSDQHKANISRSLQGKLVGHKNPMYGRTPAHGKKVIYEDRKGREFIFRSTWEFKVAAYLDGKKLDWDYETIRYDLGDETYLPDFTVYLGNGSLEHIEVKGWMTEDAQRRIQKFKEKYPIPLGVWDQKKLRELGIL